MPNEIGAHDEVFHPAGEDPYWNESGWFGFHIPERDINGFFYYFHDVRTGVSGGGPALWDGSGAEIYDCLYYDWRWHQPPTGPMEFEDFSLPNSLRHQVLDPMRRYRLSYSQPGLDLDLEWTALMEPHDFGVPPDPSIPRHFDQAGRVRGVATLHGERLEVDCFSMRDRTWGPHRHDMTPSGDFVWAVASPESHWHAIAIGVGEDAPDVVVGGYFARDGVVGNLVKGQRRVLERKSGAPARVLFEAEDDLGREFQAEGRVRSVLRWMGWPGQLAFWTLTDWEWDGQRGFGENQEFFARDLARSLLTQP
ncbi:DUF7064 domain-containing protein [Nocardia bovistercoris]|uniref:DUF7064 domain-containing protein n=1 Tax=Nocardia bovistercoris TaxID=2785916 RepID=A0A931IDH1_9NOCA|nr:hypothetical protein [Nocardia bovistercoris]MBH0779637.1 hypothetical protein [Nocardia bovistercoris]